MKVEVETFSMTQISSYFDIGVDRKIIEKFKHVHD